MFVLAVIPARGGSKRVKNKNVKLLNGKPLIEYTIHEAAKSNRLGDCLISTDSEIIRDVAINCGGKVPFLRPSELAADDTPDRPVLQHAVQWYELNNGIRPDAVALLRPTTPFKTAELIDEAIQILEDSGADSVRTMTRVESIHHPFWMYTCSEEQRANSFVPEVSTDLYFQSQSLPPVYRLNGVVDVIRTDILMNDNLPLYGKDMRILEIREEQSLDIDTELDFRLCEFLMREG